MTSEQMLALPCFFLVVLASPFKLRSRLEAENAALRHQLIVLRRKTISWSWAKCICAESCEPMLAITTTSGPTGP
jgi:hypothetical protein